MKNDSDQHEQSTHGGIASNEENHQEHSLPDGRSGLAAAIIGDHAPASPGASTEVPGFDGAGDSSTSELCADLLKNFGGARVTAGLVEELVDYLAESSFRTGHGRKGGTPRAESEWKYAFVKILKRAFKYHPSPQMYALLAIWDEPVLDDIYGHLNQAEFAEGIGLTKAAVNNAVKDEQEFFKTKPRRDQRSVAACETMSKTLISKLGPEKPVTGINAGKSKAV